MQVRRAEFLLSFILNCEVWGSSGYSFTCTTVYACVCVWGPDDHPSTSKILQQSALPGKVIRMLCAIKSILKQEPKKGTGSRRVVIPVG